MRGGQGGLVEDFTVGGWQPGELVAINNGDGGLAQAGLSHGCDLRGFQHSDRLQRRRFNDWCDGRTDLRYCCRCIEGTDVRRKLRRFGKGFISGCFRAHRNAHRCHFRASWFPGRSRVAEFDPLGGLVSLGGRRRRFCCRHGRSSAGVVRINDRRARTGRSRQRGRSEHDGRRNKSELVPKPGFHDRHAPVISSF